MERNPLPVDTTAAAVPRRVRSAQKRRGSTRPGFGVFPLQKWASTGWRPTGSGANLSVVRQLDGNQAAD